MPIITLLCFAGVVALTRNRRKGLIRAAGGLALSMALILVVIAVGRNQYITGLKPPQSPEAASAVIDTVTANLRAAVRIILIVAALVAVVAVVPAMLGCEERLATCGGRAGKGKVRCTAS